MFNTRNAIYVGISVILMLITGMGVFKFTPLQSNKLADNPKNCPYYISLQSLLANYQPLRFDKANIALIKQRLLAFEKQTLNPIKGQEIVKSYRAKYLQVLQNYDLKSIATTTDSAIILAVANQAFLNIDNFYFDERVSCVNPLYEWLPNHSRRILKYNLGGIFYGLIPDNNARIGFTNDKCEQLGVFPGYNVNNQTTTISTQFLTGMPLLTALYVIPGYNYANLGSYTGLVPWCAFWSGYLTDKNMRNILDIAGIDIFISSKSEIAKRMTKGEINGVPNVEVLTSPIKKQRFGEDYIAYKNMHSYGVAYLANTIIAQNPKEIRQYEKVINRYFARPEHHNPYKFTEATNALYGKLAQLTSRYDAIIETTAPLKIDPSQFSTSAGQATVIGIVGRNALLNADCQRSQCNLVFNISDAPGWHAYVNGKAENIERANFAFMTVPISKGQAKIWFVYEPSYVLFSYLISIFGLIAILMMKDWIIVRRN